MVATAQTRRPRAAGSGSRRTGRRHIRRTLLGKDFSLAVRRELEELTPAVRDPSHKLGLQRYFTAADASVYDQFSWRRLDVVLKDWRTGEVAFEQTDVEVPAGMSDNAAMIAASKYFRGQQGTPQREGSFWDCVQRITNPIADWGLETGYFADQAERDVFADEFMYLAISQALAPNSPVWFNIGVVSPETGELVVQQGSACFILHVDDTRVSLGNWVQDEAAIFYGGSGSGVNLSNVRGSMELLSRGGRASGPIPYMGGADMESGAIKSGGTTRRAAKMVIFDVDHPDIEEFIQLKRVAENLLRAAKAMGYDVDIDGEHDGFIAFQNANNSVRVTDEFMKAVEEDGDWHLTARTTGEVVQTIKARELMRQIAIASWECGDPGMQFDTTINHMHTLANINRITASNPCSEYMSEDNSACNLLSFNLMKFMREDNTFDVVAFAHAVRVAITYMELLVGFADYPTELIALNANRHRQLGIGYANLGSLVMALGLPYDSDAARAWCAAVTALETGEAYAMSAQIAARMGPFRDCAEPMIEVLEQHQAYAAEIDASLVPEYLLNAALDSWDRAVTDGKQYGIRNSQASVLAPTGTIGLLMDCDTTGIEPALGLTTVKKLVGGGSMTFINETVPWALRTLGYEDEVAKLITEHINAGKPIQEAPGLLAAHLGVFATSMGQSNTIHYLGHLKMMAAAQRFVSGAISKTVNLPEEISVEELEALHITAWKLGLKAVAVYRDNCKAAQPLSTGTEITSNPTLMWLMEKITADLTNAQFLEAWAALFHGRFNSSHDWTPDDTGKVALPLLRPALVYKMTIVDSDGVEHDHFVNWGLGPDGTPREQFVTASMVGSAYRGLLDQIGLTQSEAFRRGQGVVNFIDRFLGTEFAPSGRTPDPDIMTVRSPQDGLARLAACLWLTPEQQEERGVMTRAARRLKAAMLESAGLPVPSVIAAPASPQDAATAPKPTRRSSGRVQECSKCHSTNIQDGPCPTCMDCGEQLKGCSA